MFDLPNVVHEMIDAHHLYAQVHDILTNRTHLADPQGTSTASAGVGGSEAHEPPFNLTAPSWLTYGPRSVPIHPRPHVPPPFGVLPIPHTNITKL